MHFSGECLICLGDIHKNLPLLRVFIWSYLDDTASRNVSLEAFLWKMFSRRKNVSKQCDNFFLSKLRNKDCVLSTFFRQILFHDIFGIAFFWWFFGNVCSQNVGGRNYPILSSIPGLMRFHENFIWIFAIRIKIKLSWKDFHSARKQWIKN